MKDILQDLVNHTHSLGFIKMLKVTAENDSTAIDTMAEDRSVILTALTHTPVKEFTGVFGMADLDKLAYHLKNPEYNKENATIVVKSEVRDGNTVPTHIHFENENKDFKNDYRFIMKEIIDERLKSVKFKGSTWDVVIEPGLADISRLKLMAGAHSEETIFEVKTEDDNLNFYFGDLNTHAGSFTFHKNIGGSLQRPQSWPIDRVISILNLDGNKTMSITDQGAMMITVDSGMVKYNYILPAQQK